MSFSSRLLAVSKRLLETYGQLIEFKRYINTEYDPTTAEANELSEVEYSAYGHPSDYSEFEINQTTVLAGDVALILEKPSQIPAVGDIASIDNQNYRVLNVERVKAQNTDIIYKLQLRDANKR